MRFEAATDYNPNIGFFRAYHYNPNGVLQRSRDISWGYAPPAIRRALSWN